MDTASHPDELLEGCLRGERTAQKAFYERYSPGLYALALRYMGDPMLAQDVLIESFTSIFAHLGEHRKEANLVCWMRSITIRRALKHLNRKGNSLVELLPPDAPHPASHLTPETLLSTKVALAEGMARLSPVQRMVFNLVAVEGYFFTDLPNLTGIAVHTAKRHYAKAKEIMKRTLLEHEITY